MNFLTNIIGTPVPTSKPIRHGAYSVLVTVKGFVVGDPLAFGLPELMEEAAALRPGSGFVNGRLHLHSRRFPMYYPGSVPRLLLLSRHLTVMPMAHADHWMQELFIKELPVPPEIQNPDPEVLRNVLPGFEVFEENFLAPR